MGPSYRFSRKKKDRPSTKADEKGVLCCDQRASDSRACRRVWRRRAGRPRVFAGRSSGHAIFECPPGGRRSQASATAAFPTHAWARLAGHRRASELKACGPPTSARRAFPTGACFRAGHPPRVFAKRVFPIPVWGRLAARPRAEERMVCSPPISATRASLRAAGFPGDCRRLVSATGAFPTHAWARAPAGPCASEQTACGWRTFARQVWRRQV